LNPFALKDGNKRIAIIINENNAFFILLPQILNMKQNLGFAVMLAVGQK
jgi:hypothetical protein